MSAAILQGVPSTTLDTGLWIDLPPRQYIRLLNLCRGLGAEIWANTVVELSDGSTVNFVYEVHGIGSFRQEYRNAVRMQWFGAEVRVLPLERIYASKKHVGRPKDIAHLPLIEQTIRLRQMTSEGDSPTGSVDVNPRKSDTSAKHAKRAKRKSSED